ncbi:hypothetical protein ACJMK2_021465 [Sinanodonta woodiana]|uniref:Outer dynein arm-docking complex subunit 4 n=1 Tax=Sinanodonta woodiana TaxID=1069815 RepID=A0ABD3TH43_SINWO
MTEEERYDSTFTLEDTLKQSNLKRTKTYFQKADAISSTQNVTLASLSCQRDEKILSEHTADRDAIKRAERRARVKRQGRHMKVTSMGDIMTVRTHHSLAPKQITYDTEPVTETGLAMVPSAGFRHRLKNPLVKVHRLPAISLSTSHSTFQRSLRTESLESFVYNDKLASLAKITDKKTLGKLYLDKQYLEFLVGIEELSGTRNSVVKSKVADTAEDGLVFLHERKKFWNSLGPLPPPHPSRRSRVQERQRRLSPYTSIESLFSVESIKSYSTRRSFNSRATRESFSNVKSRVNSFREEQKVEKTEPPRPEKIKFQFKSYRKDEELKEMTEITEGNEGENNPETEEEVRRRREEAIKRGEEAVIFIEKEIVAVENAFNQRRYSACEKKAISCLNVLERFTDEEVPSKHILQSMLCRCLGNCAIQRKDYSKALEYHSLDLEIGEEYCNLYIQSRALSNLGRVNVLMNNYSRALDAYNRKAPLCKTSMETAWLFHEIGNCFLMMRLFEYALEAGVKALEAATEVNNARFQLQSFVLIGVVEVNMKRYNEAYHHIEEALENAKVIDDGKSQEVLTLVLIDINKKMVQQMQSKASSRRLIDRKSSPRPYRVPPLVVTQTSAQTNIVAEG